MEVPNSKLDLLIASWLDEDIGRGDLASAAITKEKAIGHWEAKQDGVFCGAGIIEKVFKKLDNEIILNFSLRDGEKFKAGQKLLEIKGSAKALVMAERTSLNIAMRLSGIATSTADLIDQLKGTKTKLVDTRKTTPGLRLLEKYAFCCGGGRNHRLGLDDAAMLKENHLACSKGIKDAITAIRLQTPWPSKIIVEAETAEQAKEGIIAGADGILLDEFQPDELKKLVTELRQLYINIDGDSKLNNSILEASGVNPLDLKEYGLTGVDLISTSAPMTKSSWIDMSMRIY